MATNARPLIRVPVHTYELLKVVSKETGRTMSELASEAIDGYSRKRFWQEVNRAFAAMTPEEWRQYRKEFEEWEVLAGDPLPREDWGDEWRAQQRDAATPRRTLVDGSQPRARSRAGRQKASSRRLR